MKEEKKECEHLWETYRTESRIREEEHRGHYFKNGEITIVEEVFCKKCLRIKKI